MKFEIVSRYLARLYMRVSRSAPTLMRLAADLAEKVELGNAQLLDDIDLGAGQVSQGCMLTSPDRTWLIRITSESFDVQVSQGYNVAMRTYLPVATFGAYLNRVRELFEIGTGLVSVKPDRIALVQSGVLGSAEGSATSLGVYVCG